MHLHNCHSISQLFHSLAFLNEPSKTTVKHESLVRRIFDSVADKIFNARFAERIPGLWHMKAVMHGSIQIRTLCKLRCRQAYWLFLTCGLSDVRQLSLLINTANFVGALQLAFTMGIVRFVDVAWRLTSSGTLHRYQKDKRAFRMPIVQN